MYDDDLLHAKALELLERNYTMRVLLIGAAKAVILLHRPTFADAEKATELNPLRAIGALRSQQPSDIGSSAIVNYEDLSCTVGYLLFLIRSTQVWAVQSDINGPFELEKHAQLLGICERLTAFLWSPTKTVNDGQTAIADLHDDGFDFGLGVQLLTLGRGRVESTKDAASSAASIEGEIGGEEDLVLNSTHQNVLRAMDLQTSLIAALGVDYNLAFSGDSEASLEDKLKSRSVLISTVRTMVNLLELFVSANSANQELVFAAALPALRSHLGGLQKPLNFEVCHHKPPHPSKTYLCAPEFYEFSCFLSLSLFYLSLYHTLSV
jgi:hypothetical protein